MSIKRLKKSKFDDDGQILSKMVKISQKMIKLKIDLFF